MIKRKDYSNVVGWMIVAFIIAMAWLCLQIPANAQHSGQGAVPSVESTTKPSAGTATEWTRTTDSAEFNLNTTLNKWLGPERVFHFGKNATGVTGALNMSNNVVADTTTANGDGYYVPDSCYVTAIYCVNDAVIATACSLEVFSGVTRIYANAWTGSNEQFYPAALVWPANMRLTVYVKSGATNPDRPMVDVITRPFVTP